MSSKALSLYRQLFRCIRRVDDVAKQRSFMSELQTGYRLHHDERDPTKIEALLKQAESKLSFLLVLLPMARRPLSMRKLAQTRLIFETSESLERNPYIGAHGNHQIHQYQIDRHRQQMERFRFRGPERSR